MSCGGVVIKKALCFLPHDGVVAGKRYEDHLRDAEFSVEVITFAGWLNSAASNKGNGAAAV